MLYVAFNSSGLPARFNELKRVCDRGECIVLIPSNNETKILQDIWQYEVDNVLRIPFPTAAQIWFYKPELHNVLHNFQWLFPHVVSTTFEYLWLER